MDETVVSNDVRETIAARGRKDGGQTKVINLDELSSERVQNLLGLKIVARTATEEFGEAIRATAEKAGIQSSVLRKYINALAAKKTGDQKRNAEQLCLLFENIPT